MSVDPMLRFLPVDGIYSCLEHDPQTCRQTENPLAKQIEVLWQEEGAMRMIAVWLGNRELKLSVVEKIVGKILRDELPSAGQKIVAPITTCVLKALESAASSSGRV